MRLLVPAVAAAAALVLAGCSEPEPGSPLPTGGGVATSDAPSAAPSATSSATPSTGGAEETEGATATAEPSATPTAAPTLPPEAMTNDAAGAEAFVRYWFDTLNFAYATRDPNSLAAASTQDCEVCNSYIEDFSELRDGSVLGGKVTIVEVVAPAPDATGSVLVSTVIDQEASKFLDADGEPIEESAGGQESLGSVIVWREDEWLMYGLGY